MNLAGRGVVIERIVVWFSCGAASAVTLKKAVEKYGKVSAVYCDVSKDESEDNPRFMRDVEKWTGNKIEIIRSAKFTSVEEVWSARSYMSGIKGAPCTVEMKKIPRFEFQKAGDLNLFGFTVDEKNPNRIRDFEDRNPDLLLEWILRDSGIKKSDCFRIIQEARIELPVLYKVGFQNNNCIGCVKATSPAYWNLVRKYKPEIFERRAKQSREIGCRLTRLYGKRIFLDELPVGNYGRYKMEDISCGPECSSIPAAPQI